MNNDQAMERLMKLYQAEGEKILTGTDDSELMSALDCAFGAFQALEEAILYCNRTLDIESNTDADDLIDETCSQILEILERYKDDR